jgi:hypothetical protein
MGSTRILKSGGLELGGIHTASGGTSSELTDNYMRGSEKGLEKLHVMNFPKRIPRDLTRTFWLGDSKVLIPAGFGGSLYRIYELPISWILY